MIDELSHYIAVFLAKNDGKETDNVPIYEVGVDVILSTGITAIGVMLIAILMRSMLGGWIYLFCFMTIRSYSGGYHASTRTKCFLLTCGMFAAVSLGVKTINEEYRCLIIAGLTLTDILTFYLFVPIENKNKILPEDWKIQNKKKAWISMLTWKGIAFCLYAWNVEIALYICLTETVITLLILQCKPWEEKKNEE